MGVLAVRTPQGHNFVSHAFDGLLRHQMLDHVLVQGDAVDRNGIEGIVYLQLSLRVIQVRVDALFFGFVCRPKECGIGRPQSDSPGVVALVYGQDVRRTDSVGWSVAVVDAVYADEWIRH